MNKSRLYALVVSAAACLLALPASAVPPAAVPPTTSSDDTSEGNIFTPPANSDQQRPHFSEGGPGMRRGLGGHKDGVPDFHQIKNLPSLTPQQRQQIKQIMDQSKAQMDPIKEQLETLRGKTQGDPGQSLGDADTREKFMDLRRQMKDAHKQTWEQIKKVLSEQQLQELESMRHGEMQPATFNRPMVGNGGAGWARQQQQQMKPSGDGFDQAPPSNGATPPAPVP